MEETKEQLLIRRVFKLIASSHFNDFKMMRWYCDNVNFERSLGDDISNYVQAKNPEYYHKLRKELTK